MTEEILLGFTVPEGHRYTFKMHHIVATGMTQLSGKSTTVETILKRRSGKSLVFLTKRGEKIFQDARRIQPFYKERFDWEYVRSLLQAAWHEKLKFETPWIIRISKHSDSLKSFRKGLAYELSKPKLREFDRNVYMVLAAYLDKILPTLEQAKQKFTDRLELKPGMNVMDLTEWYTHEEVQMVVIRACMEWILEKENDVTVALPEAWKMLPQTRNTPVKLYFEKFIREGATNGNYLIIDAQDLGGVDKTPLRQVNVWIMGRMKEANEVARLLKQTLGLKMKPEVIQKLPLGHFIVAVDDVKKVYVWAHGVPEDVAIKVARGELTPEYVRDKYLKREKEDDLMYKERALKAEKKLEMQKTWISPEKLAEKIKAETTELRQEVTKRIGEVVGLEKDKERLQNALGKTDEIIERLAHLEKDAEAIKKFKEALGHLLQTGVSQDQINKVVDERLKERLGVRDLSIEHKELNINILHSKEQVKINTETQIGRILFCAIKDLPREGWSIKEMSEALDERGWHINMNSLNPNIGQLVKNGRLVKMGQTRASKYRLPTKLPFKITEN